MTKHELTLPVLDRSKELYMSADLAPRITLPRTLAATAVLHAGIHVSPFEQHGVHISLPAGTHIDTVHDDNMRYLDERREDGSLKAEMKPVHDNAYGQRLESYTYSLLDDEGDVSKPDVSDATEFLAKMSEETLYLDIYSITADTPVNISSSLKADFYQDVPYQRSELEATVTETTREVKNAAEGAIDVVAEVEETEGESVRERAVTFEEYQQLANYAAENGYGDAVVYAEVTAGISDSLNNSFLAKVFSKQAHNPTFHIDIYQSREASNEEVCVIAQQEHPVRIEISEQTPIGFTVPFVLPILASVAVGVRNRRLKSRYTSDKAPVPGKSTIKSIEAGTGTIDDLIALKRYELARESEQTLQEQKDTPTVAMKLRAQQQHRKISRLKKLRSMIYIASFGAGLATLGMTIAFEKDEHVSPPITEVSETNDCPDDAAVYKGEENSSIPHKDIGAKPVDDQIFTVNPR